jgi:K+-transporting ATPase ATPase C chain
MLRRHFFAGLRMTICLTVLLGVLYPFAVFAVGHLTFGDRADGSFVTGADGSVVGSSLLGQRFVDADGNPDPRYFQPRPSAAGSDGYDALASGGSNLGPSNPNLADTVQTRVDAYRQLNGLGADAEVPVDAVTASGSGLDPHISVANANLQASRVAAVRGLTIAEVQSLIAKHTEDRQLGFLGEKVVNVLLLNLDLDA